MRETHLERLGIVCHHLWLPTYPQQICDPQLLPNTVMRNPVRLPWAEVHLDQHCLDDLKGNSVELWQLEAFYSNEITLDFLATARIIVIANGILNQVKFNTWIFFLFKYELTYVTWILVSFSLISCKYVNNYLCTMAWLKFFRHVVTKRKQWTKVRSTVPNVFKKKQFEIFRWVMTYVCFFATSIFGFEFVTWYKFLKNQKVVIFGAAYQVYQWTRRDSFSITLTSLNHNKSYYLKVDKNE